jgi:hypothetical protein
MATEVSPASTLLKEEAEEAPMTLVSVKKYPPTFCRVDQQK